METRAETQPSRYRGSDHQQAALGDSRRCEPFHVGGSYQVTPALLLGAALYDILDTDYAIYDPYRSGAATVLPPAFAINQEGRRLLLSANMAF